jgi:hypothetical protein
VSRGGVTGCLMVENNGSHGGRGDTTAKERENAREKKRTLQIFASQPLARDLLLSHHQHGELPFVPFTVLRTSPILS